MLYLIVYVQNQFCARMHSPTLSNHRKSRSSAHHLRMGTQGGARITKCFRCPIGGRAWLFRRAISCTNQVAHSRLVRMPRGGSRPGSGRPRREGAMTKLTLRLKTSTVERLKAESRRRDPDNSRSPIGPVIDSLVEEHLGAMEKPTGRKRGAK